MLACICPKCYLAGLMLIKIGQFNPLKVLHVFDDGAVLDGGQYGEIPLHERDMPADCKVDDIINVFVYPDSEDQLVATTETPKAQAGEFALLEVVSIESIGAFLDWGLPKDLFLPFAEQARELHIGDEVLVYIYQDNSKRLCASMRIEKHSNKKTDGYKVGQPVDLILFGKSDLGYKALINKAHTGILFSDEVFQKLHYGQSVKAYIKSVRPDGKIDLILQKTGHKAGLDIEPSILAELEKNNGFLNINDKTAAETIYDLFGVSKKKYKIALGGLYKKRLITVEDDGIRLVSKQKD